MKLENYELARYPLGNGRYVVVCKFNGNVYVHVRQYERKGDMEYPTRTGTSMTPKRFKLFTMTVPKIDEGKLEVEGGSETVNVCEHIGGGVNVSVNSGFRVVNIRKHFVPMGAVTPIPTRMGIALKFSEWEKLVEKLDEIKNLTPELTNAEPCYTATDHSNVMGFLQCKECTPHGIDLTYQ